MYKQLEKYRSEKGRVRAFLYARCSSDEQKKNGYTITDQLDFGRLFCRENDIIIVGEYVDEGISATLEIRKRKDLANLIRDSASGEADIVVFKCIDRFFRNTEEFYTAQKELRKSGVTWLSIEEPDLDPNDADAAFKINIYLAMAEYEARKTSKRIRFNNKMRVKNKQVVTGNQCFMFPWKVVGEKKNRHLEKDMEQAKRLYDILDHFEMHQSKSATLAYHNSKYDPISYGTLTNLLTDTLLYGEYKGVQDYVMPWITKARFDNIQSILQRNSRNHPTPDRVFLFSGMIKCHCCGRNMTGNYYHRNRITPIFHYRCNQYRLDKKCANNLALNEKKIEAQLLDNLEQYIKNEIVRVKTIKEKKSPAVDHTKKIAELKKEIQRLNTMYRKGRIEDDEYDRDYAELEKELKKLESVEAPEEKDLTALVKLLESDYRTMYEALDKPHRKAFWRKIIQEFTVDETKTIRPESIIFF
jgi:DNA invertase Pin-like site-specific DNA recombinase